MPKIMSSTNADRTSRMTNNSMKTKTLRDMIGKASYLLEKNVAEEVRIGAIVQSGSDLVREAKDQIWLQIFDDDSEEMIKRRYAKRWKP